jgi:hypothetical protein
MRLANGKVQPLHLGGDGVSNGSVVIDLPDDPQCERMATAIEAAQDERANILSEAKAAKERGDRSEYKKLKAQLHDMDKLLRRATADLQQLALQRSPPLGPTDGDYVPGLETIESRSTCRTTDGSMRC